MNKCFSNSTYLLTAIITFRDVLAFNINDSVTSKVFIEYMRELDSFLIINNWVLISNWLIIIDNAFIYR